MLNSQPFARSRIGRVCKTLISSKAIITLALSVVILFLPVLLLDFSVVAQNPEQYLTGTAKEHLGYFLRDPTGSIIELAFAGYSKKEVLNGRVPLWSPFQGLGQPFVADIPSSALFAPLNAFRLVLPSRYWTYIFVGNLLIGCIFVFMLCRSYGVRPFAAVPAGLSFAALGTTQVFLSVSSVIMVAAWIPLLFYGIERILKSNAKRRHWLPLLFGIYGVVTGGHPTITLLAGMFAAIYLCVRLIQLRLGLSRIVIFCAAAAVGVLLTAIQWVPFAAYVAYRGNTFTDYSTFRFDMRHFAALVVPYIYGPLNATASATSPPVELTNYWSLGWIPPVLLSLVAAGLLTLVRGKEIRSGPVALVGVAALFFLWAFGVPPFSLASKLPFYNRVRGHYIAVTVAFAVCVLAGYGLQALQLRRVKLWEAGAGAGIIITVAGASAVWVLTAGRVDAAAALSYIASPVGYAALWAAAPVVILSVLLRKGKDSDREYFVLVTALAVTALAAIAFFPWASAAAIQTARHTAVLGLGVTAAVLCTVGSTHRRIAVALVITAIAASRLWVTTAPQHLPRKQHLFELPQYARILEERLTPEFRAYGLDGFLFPNFSSAARISTINVSTGMVTQEVERFFRNFLDERQGPEQFLGVDQTGALKDGPAAQYLKRKRFWDYVAVRYIVAKPAFASQQRAFDGEMMSLRPGVTPHLLAEPTTIRFQCPKAEIGGMCVFLGTYGRVNPGRLFLSARNDRGTVIARSEIDSASIQDLACTRFDLPTAVCGTSGNTLKLELTHEKTSASSGLAVFRLPQGDGIQFHLLSHRNAELSQIFVDPVSAGEVWESTTARPRAYIAPETSMAGSWQAAQDTFGSQSDLRRTAFVDENNSCVSNKTYPPGKEAGRLLALDVNANTIVADVEAFTPGTFVLVDAFAPGWNASVDGSRKQLFRVNGVFRGTCIDSTGRHRIVMEYAPTHWRAAVATTTLGIALCITMAISRRSKTSSQRKLEKQPVDIIPRA
jgi:hypothetical protein